MSSKSIQAAPYAGASSMLIDPEEDGWAVMDADGPRVWPTYQYSDLDFLMQRPGSGSPPAWFNHLQPMLPSGMAASATGLHGSLRAHAAWAVPYARRASSASAVVGAQALRGATQVATQGPPQARRIATHAWAMSQRFGTSVQDQMRWIWFSSDERRVAETFYDWLSEYGYIIEGQLEVQPEVAMIIREGVRRVPGLEYVNIAQWRGYCQVLVPFEGMLTPWGLAAKLKQI